ncbi:chorismate mutase [Shewanella sp. WE21]|uniref:chorismate mutase n=1 Tax=Shewanella sp. WE21 TaxID=2029986 RepID=UPI000CF5E86F|nr:chorismate mutase [Shewanella sp. WE21]AVI67737.1 chorismate mutase [Shewanella sp. WE21]
MKSKILFLLSFISPISSNASDESLSFLINQRFSYMKDVAAYKAAHHIEIEDLEQEEKILLHTQDLARTIGLDASSITPFIKAQMDVSKAIQYRYLADWLTNPEPQFRALPLASVRVEIMDISNRIINNIAIDIMKEGQLDNKKMENLLTELNHAQLESHDKVYLYETLLKIRALEPKK